MAKELWYLDVVRNGISPTNESNTSRYVHEVLTDCLGWPFEAIIPQAGKKGYIDYQLKFPDDEVVRVEVKSFGKKLVDEMIHKYLVRPGPAGKSLRVGVLTNFQKWKIFAAGPEVKRAADTSMVCVMDVEVKSRKDINLLKRLIGFRQDGYLGEVRAMLAEVDDVVHGILVKDDRALDAVRQWLRKHRKQHGENFGIPGFEPTAESIGQLIKGRNPNGLKFDVEKFCRAVCSREVAAAVDGIVMENFGAKSQKRRVRQTIQRLLLGSA